MLLSPVLLRPSRWAFVAIAALASAAVTGAPRGALASPAVTPTDAATAPAVRYGKLSKGACESELVRRGVAFTSLPGARGVVAPVRITAPIRGVSFRTELPTKMRATTPYEIADCRLVLALDDFAAILAKHDVIEVHHFSMYRPPGTHWPAGKAGTRHAGALAIDAGKFIRKDGSVLDVEKDFHGLIGNPTCGPGAGPDPATPAALELRKIVCEAADARLFNVELTPDYNYEHRNHFHLEVTANVSWFLVH